MGAARRESCEKADPVCAVTEGTLLSEAHTFEKREELEQKTRERLNRKLAGWPPARRGTG